MIFDIITLFPEMFSALKSGIVGRALENGLIALNFWNPRDYAKGSYRKVDDSPYGGGPGMVMMIEPLMAAIQAAKTASNEQSTVINLTPQGKNLSQQLLKNLLKNKKLILIAGRYEGIDERLIELTVDEEISIGDYVLSGGELPAMVVIDALTRLLPGALGDEHSAEQDSFVDGLLDYPHYTQPRSICGKEVPAVLLSGDHAAINRFRRKEALGRTWLRRPDLIKKLELTAADSVLLSEFIDENAR